MAKRHESEWVKLAPPDYKSLTLATEIAVGAVATSLLDQFKELPVSVFEETKHWYNRGMGRPVLGWMKSTVEFISPLKTPESLESQPEIPGFENYLVVGGAHTERRQELRRRPRHAPSHLLRARHLEGSLELMLAGRRNDAENTLHLAIVTDSNFMYPQSIDPTQRPVDVNYHGYEDPANPRRWTGLEYPISRRASYVFGYQELLATAGVLSLAAQAGYGVEASTERLQELYEDWGRKIHPPDYHQYNQQIRSWMQPTQA